MALRETPLWLAEITAYDPALGATRVLRVASGNGYITKPSESPSNQPYDARIANPIDISRTMFSGNATSGRSTPGYGDLVLDNADGGLDDWSTLGFDGQSVVIRRTWALTPAYPTDFTSWTLTAESVECTTNEVRLRIRDRQQLAATAPFQTTKYAGSNALPNGLEGTADDLLGKPKPVLYGKAYKIPAPCVNTSKLIYQVSDGAIASVDAVYDRGIPLGAGLGNWTLQTTGLSNTQSAILYSGSLFVIGGGFGDLATSPDGVTWTVRTSAFGGDGILGLAYGNGVYVAVGTGGKVSTSPDGVTWTAQTSGFGSTTIRGVAYGNGLFVAVGDSGTLTTSPDGITWTTRTSGFGIVSIRAVAYGNGLFVAVGDSGVATTSPDGVTWTANTTGFDSVTYSSVAYGGRKWLAGSAGGTMLSSLDGFAWSGRTTGFAGFASSSIAKSIRGIAYGNGSYVFCGPPGSSGGTLASSTDGEIWIARAIGSTPTLNAAVYGNGKFLVTGSSGAVYVAATNSTYASQADLLDDTKAPAPGTFKYLSDASGSYFRLGAKPDGLILCDATEGASSANRTGAQIASRVLGRTPTAETFVSADLTALDAANSAVQGIWVGTDDTTVGEVLDRCATSCGAWWGVDGSGAFRIQQVTAPSGTPVLTITKDDIKQGSFERVTPNDVGAGVPNYRVTVRYARNYQTMDSDLAAGVSDADRAVFAHEWRDVTSTDATVLTAHPLSQPLEIESLYASSADAQTECTRVRALRGVPRDMYEMTVELNTQTAALELNDVVMVFYPRFALSTVGDTAKAFGALFRVIALRPNAAAKELGLTVWGACPTTDYYYNLLGDDGAYLLGPDGAYLLGTLTGT